MLLQQKATEWRRHIHQYPELSTKEFKTAEFVANKLTEFGLEVHTGIGGTGVVGVLQNGNSKRSIGLRADMDALQIHEQNSFDYVSKNKGIMHACGHDGHTAMLLGAASKLAENKDFDGTVYFIFQPDEERGTGARAMINDGLFTRWPMNAVYGMHNIPGVPKGKFVTRPNALMASESSFKIVINATGGHAALPHMGTDPIVVGAQVVTALQTIISRNLSAIDETAVISVTNFETNGTVNVIPSKVTITGDTRSFTDSTLHKIEKAIERVVAGLCMASGVDYDYHFNNSYLSTINTPEETIHAVKAAEKVVGAENVNGNCERYTISEDFSFMLREVDGCYIMIGNGEGECGGTALHNPLYDFNDDILPIGINYWVALVNDQLN